MITCYFGLVDPEKIGLTVTAFARVRLDQQGDRHLAAFEERIGGFSEVMGCCLMTGESDYQLRILVKSRRGKQRPNGLDAI